MSEKTNEAVKLDLFSIACLFTLVFLLLKIFGAIQWGWVWVFFPLLLWFGVGITAFLVFFSAAIWREYKKGGNDE